MPDDTFATAGFPHLILRPMQDADQPGIDQLYHSNRTDLHALPMPPEVIDTLICQQQHFQACGIADNYPQAQILILATPEHPAQQGQVLARLVTDQGPQHIHLIDIMVHPMVHRCGLARQLLRYLQNIAISSNSPISLQVMKDNQRALALYLSCGFEITHEDYLSAQMRWIPSPQHST